MLEKLPTAIGRTLWRVRPGLERTVVYRRKIATGVPALALASPAFDDQRPIPKRYTADGEGLSPPLRWSGAPKITRSFALIVEDADSPTPAPLVHAIVARLPPEAEALDDGAIELHEGGPLIGRNSFLKTGWLPPDPPPGHGPHRYVFQLFALDRVPELGVHPGRSALVEAIDRHALAYGVLVGTYSR
jgi:hypothetical protein